MGREIFSAEFADQQALIDKFKERIPKKTLRHRMNKLKRNNENVIPLKIDRLQKTLIICQREAWFNASSTVLDVSTSGRTIGGRAASAGNTSTNGTPARP